MIEMLKYIPDSFQVMSSNMIPDIRVWRDQAGPVFTGNDLKWANEGIYVFRRKFPFKVLKAKEPDVLRHAAFMPIEVSSL
jgi:hypothetical protein